jgi:hypothetical protein
MGILLSGAAWIALRPHEARYNGRPLTFWLESHYSGPGNQKVAAEEAIRAIGTNGIPTLLQLLEAKDTDLGARLCRLASRQHFIRLAYYSASSKHVWAMAGFEILGPSASNAVPHLVRMYEKCLTDPESPSPAVPLGCIGPGAVAAIPVLLQGTTNGNSRVRHSAIWVLGCVHREPNRVVPALAGLLSDPSESVRSVAANSLGKFGEEATAAVPALRRALSDTNGMAREAASSALKKICPESQMEPKGQNE